jgi:hypothetical protein
MAVCAYDVVIVGTNADAYGTGGHIDQEATTPLDDSLAGNKPVGVQSFAEEWHIIN